MRPRRTRPAEASAEGPGPPGETAEEVIARLKRGDITALEEIVELYGDRVFSVCLGILANHADAEDASQEVFLRAFQQASKFEGRSRYSTWLLRIATNHTLNRAKAALRRKRISEPLPEDTASAMPAPEHAAIGSERRAAVARVLQQVPLEQRQVLVLREMEGLSYAEIADVLRIPVGTVTSRLIRGRRQLRVLVRESGSDALDPG